jgi:hypothetical protein
MLRPLRCSLLRRGPELAAALLADGRPAVGALLGGIPGRSRGRAMSGNLGTDRRSCPCRAAGRRFPAVGTDGNRNRFERPELDAVHHRGRRGRAARAPGAVDNARIGHIERPCPPGLVRSRCSAGSPRGSTGRAGRAPWSRSSARRWPALRAGSRFPGPSRSSWAGASRRSAVVLVLADARPCALAWSRAGARWLVPALPAGCTCTTASMYLQSRAQLLARIRLRGASRGHRAAGASLAWSRSPRCSRIKLSHRRALAIWC